jgi:hypothetical protein
MQADRIQQLNDQFYGAGYVYVRVDQHAKRKANQRKDAEPDEFLFPFCPDQPWNLKKSDQSKGNNNQQRHSPYPLPS